MVFPLQLRIWAVMAFYLGQQDMARAMVMFAGWAGAEHGVKSLRHFIQYWKTTFEKTGSVESKYKGRQPSMPDDVARLCVTVLLGGYTLDKIAGKHPTSLNEDVRSRLQFEV